MAVAVSSSASALTFAFAFAFALCIRFGSTDAPLTENLLHEWRLLPHIQPCFHHDKVSMKRLMFVHSLLNALRAKLLQQVRQWSQRHTASRAPALVPIRIHASQREQARRRYRHYD